ncbi:hypothetical protein KKB83_04635 [Patescibacteria group bacterium]|nr:hypothetical protein [Patescibacteria group bacterium]
MIVIKMLVLQVLTALVGLVCILDDDNNPRQSKADYLVPLAIWGVIANAFAIFGSQFLRVSFGDFELSSLGNIWRIGFCVVFVGLMISYAFTPASVAPKGIWVPLLLVVFSLLISTVICLAIWSSTVWAEIIAWPFPNLFGLY